jgi:hypothetical protein
MCSEETIPGVTSLIRPGVNRSAGSTMAKEVANFNDLVAYLISCKIEDSDAIHIAEHFMDSQQVQFDADGNFASVNVEYDPGSKTVVKK